MSNYMTEPFGSRLVHAWNAFRRPETTFGPFDPGGYTYGVRPDRVRLNLNNERSTIATLYNRLSLDVASNEIAHVRRDDNKRYLETIDSSLNYCLTVEANIDQSARAFIQDAVLTMFDTGCIAIVPVDATEDPEVTGSYDIKSMRVGRVVQWYPQHVRVQLYNDRSGRKEEVTLSKRNVAIIENPLYSVMNEPNSTLQRLVRKLNMLDAVDEQSSSGKLDLLIQLPYVIKSDSRRVQVENRRKDIEMQLAGSKYGIAYIDGTEKVTQLNRPAENNLLTQVTYLTALLHNQLGVTESVIDGTADEKTMINYYNRTIEPVLASITDGMARKFLTRTARTQGQAIVYLHDPFKLVSVSEIADLADKMTRNEIMSSNEIRSIIGFRPSSDPVADQLRNKNLNPVAQPDAASEKPPIEERSSQDSV